MNYIVNYFVFVFVVFVKFQNYYYNKLKNDYFDLLVQFEDFYFEKVVNYLYYLCNYYCCVFVENYSYLIVVLELVVLEIEFVET